MNKTVLITGTSSGIGKECIKLFAENGWNVAATSRNVDKNKQQSKKIKRYELDITDQKAVERVFTQVIEDFGQIDVVVNNAGYSVKGVFETIGSEEIKKQFDTNVFGLMSVSRAAIKHMRKQKSGTIVQVASMGGRLTFPLYSIYHSSKWAVEGFSESLQFETKPLGIKIKIIEPGVIKTNFYKKNQRKSETKAPEIYNKITNTVDKNVANSSDNGVDPIKVAKIIYKAANDSSAKLRYVVGSPAPMLLAVRKILPERLFIWIIKKNFRI